MFRDIKPDNIGFDRYDVIKLFDFGLIKEYNTKQATYVKDDMSFYHCTAMTGSYIYMDPYVAHGFPYNELCDVYSFCILLWQMMELQEPYHNYTIRNMYQKVWIPNNGDRPILSNHNHHPKKKKNCSLSFLSSLHVMIQNGWSYDYKKRPTMSSICETFQHILQQSDGTRNQDDNICCTKIASSTTIQHHHHDNVIDDDDDSGRNYDEDNHDRTTLNRNVSFPKQYLRSPRPTIRAWSKRYKEMTTKQQQ
jgi:serine/threonine protein kinase